MTLSRVLLLSLFLGGLLQGCSQPPAETRSVSLPVPSLAVLQEMHDLHAERTRLVLKRRYFEKLTKKGPTQDATATSNLQQIDDRLAEIVKRLETIHENELGQFERVAIGARLGCSEEPLYGQGSYGVILHAVAEREIKANELLLFHAAAVYRTAGTFQTLTTTGVGWYFRPNTTIPKGKRFVVSCIQDAPEEILKVKNGFMPDSDRARDPTRPYRTQIFGLDDKPIPPADPVG
jgi:hypothetical protein